MASSTKQIQDFTPIIFWQRIQRINDFTDCHSKILNVGCGSQRASARSTIVSVLHTPDTTHSTHPKNFVNKILTPRSQIVLLVDMETDREVLLWFHQRLVHRHKESHLFDYMHRLRWIILETPSRKTSRGQRIKKTCYSVGELGKLMKNKTRLEKQLIDEG